MNCHQTWDDTQLEPELQEISDTIWEAAKRCEGDSYSLLSLLRSLERLHREIQEKLFEPSLPDTRNALYHLLREIEETGGWPYIERMKLQALFGHLKDELGTRDEG